MDIVGFIEHKENRSKNEEIIYNIVKQNNLMEVAEVRDQMISTCNK